MDTWSKRRGGVHYISESETHTDAEAEDRDKEPSGEELQGSAQPQGTFNKFKRGAWKFFHSMALSDEDEILFIHGSWELAENGVGRFSAMLDYLVYRSFYALVLLGLTIYAIALNANQLADYPILHFVTAGTHIAYSVLYTLHIVAGKTQRTKEKDKKKEKDVEEQVITHGTHHGSKVTIHSSTKSKAPTQIDSRSDLAKIDIVYNVRNKPHPIQTPDKVVWLLFNVFAATTISTALIDASGYAKMTNKTSSAASLLNFVFLGYMTFALILELWFNCIPMRLSHFIYPFSLILIYGLCTYLIEEAGKKPEFVQQNWKHEAGSTAVFYLVGSVITLIAHFVICGMSWIRSHIIYIISTQRRVRTVAPDKRKNLIAMVETEKTLRAAIESPTFHEDFEREEKEKEEMSEKLRASKVKNIYVSGAKSFMERLGARLGRRSDPESRSEPSTKEETTKARPASFSPEEMTTEEFVRSLNRRKKDGIAYLPKSVSYNNLDWVKPKQTASVKSPISGIKREIIPKKWNEFSTPENSLKKRTLEYRHKRFGRGKVKRKPSQDLEAHNVILANAPIFHHLTSESKNRLKRTSSDVPDFNERHKNVLASLKRASSKSKSKSPPPPEREIKLSETKGNHSLDIPKRRKRKKRKTDESIKQSISLTGVRIHDNWVPFVPIPKVVAPKAKWYLGDSSFMPPPPKPVPNPEPDRIPRLEHERNKLEELIRKKLRSKSLAAEVKRLTRERRSMKYASTDTEKKSDDAQKSSIDPPRPSEHPQQIPLADPTPGPSKIPKVQAYKPSEFIKRETERQKLREARLKAKEEGAHRPGIAFIKSKDEEERIMNERRAYAQEQKAKKLANEKMQKPRQPSAFGLATLTGNPEDANHPDNHLIRFLLSKKHRKNHLGVLAKNTNQGILKPSRPPRSSVASRTSSMSLAPNERPKTVDELVNRSQRSNLQFQARARALGPMVGSAYHPLRPPAVPATTGDALTFHYLDAKVGPQTVIPRRDLENYHYHPGTHVHHPIRNLEHAEGPHESLKIALKEHISTKLKNLEKYRDVHPVLEPVPHLPTEIPKKDDPTDNPFRVIAFHPVVQLRSFDKAKEKDKDKEKDKAEEQDPKTIPPPPPKLKEIYPRVQIAEARRLDRSGSDTSLGSNVKKRDKKRKTIQGGRKTLAKAPSKRWKSGKKK